LNGAQVGQTPLAALPLDADKRAVIEITLDGYKPVRQDVLGRTQTLDLNLEPLPAVPTPAPEVVLKLVSTPPGAQVVLNDAVLGTTPLEFKAKKSEAELAFIFRLPGHRPEKRAVAPTADAEVKATLLKNGGPLRPGPQPHDDLGIKTGR
jgi:hypothetical protein